MKTTFTDLLGITHPLVGFNRSPGVVAAVSRAGGLGVLAATAYTPEQLDVQLTWIEEHTGGRPYGVDLLVPAKTAQGDRDRLIDSLRAQIPPEHIAFIDGLLERYSIPERPADAPLSESTMAANVNAAAAEMLLDVVFDHPIALVANALGTPPPSMVERAKVRGVVLASLVGQADHARKQLECGVDVLVAQGTEAGGHTGTIATMILTPEIVDIAGDRPELAAGGIASGRQMAAGLALGAAGVWCGSVWLATDEDITPLSMKQKFLAANSTDTVVSKTRTGKPARQLRTVWHDEWDTPGSPAPLPMPLQPILVRDAWERIDAAAASGHEPAQRLQSFFVGQVVGSFVRLRPTEQVVNTIIDECDAQLRRLGAAVS